MPKSRKTAIPKTYNNSNVRTLENIYMDGMAILEFVNSKVPRQIRSILALNAMTIDQIDLFIFHQASKIALDFLTRILKIKPEKTFRNIRDIGNTVSASIPIALKDALENRKVSRSDKVLLSGFGAGLSWGSVIMEI